MGKRFFDTDLWEKEWFQKLSPVNKCLWNYVLLHCDLVGVWTPNIRHAEMCIGGKINVQSFLDGVNGNIEVTDTGKWYIIDFVEYQNGKVAEDSKSPVQQKIVFMLKKHGLWDIYLNRVSNRVSCTLLDRDKVKVRVKVEVGEEVEVENTKHSCQQKTEVAEGVLLSEEEVAKLKAKFTDYETRLRTFSLSKAAHGYKYKSDYAAILSWALKDPAAPTKKPDKICPECHKVYIGSMCDCGWYRGQAK